MIRKIWDGNDHLSDAWSINREGNMKKKNTFYPLWYELYLETGVLCPANEALKFILWWEWHLFSFVIHYTDQFEKGSTNKCSSTSSFMQLFFHIPRFSTSCTFSLCVKWSKHFFTWLEKTRTTDVSSLMGTELWLNFTTGSRQQYQTCNRRFILGRNRKLWSCLLY